MIIDTSIEDKKMAEPTIPEKAKLFIGIIYNNEIYLEQAFEKLKKKYGDIDYQSNPIPFTHTEYYNEIGKNLNKVFYSFKKLIKREDIVKVKLYTNGLEEKISGKKNRVINIDPGYLTLANVYLATCKDFFHRTYLSKGIFLENEYRYVGKQYLPWEWTYPDYKKYDYLLFFQDIRKIYAAQIKG